MGTRADFYVGRGEQAEWIGSIAWDGYPSGIANDVLKATTESEFRAAVEKFFADDREDVTLPEQGWPWPWDTSHTTDYAYAFDAGRVHASAFGYAWFAPQGDDGECQGVKSAVFPNMKDRKNVTLGKRSGTISIAGGKIIND